MADTAKQQSLQSLANALPVANQQVANQQKAARDMRVQQAVAAAPKAAPIASTAQNTAAGVEQQAGSDAVGRAQSLIQTEQQVGAQGLANQQQTAEQTVSDAKQGAQQGSFDNAQRLEAVDAKAKKELYDDQLQFQKDQDGQTLFNETQLMDYAKLNAQKNEDLKNYAQLADQAHQRKIEIMQAAQGKLEEELKFEYSKDKQDQDQASILKIRQTINDMNKRIANAKSSRANKAAGWNAGGTIVGEVIGGIYGGPEGAAAGGKAGGATGSSIANNTG